MPAPRPLLDSWGRLHRYLRVSVTDRCNYRCVYCLPEEGQSWMPRAELLSYEEIARLVGAMVPMGVRHVRLTGGEPTVRRDIVRLVGALAAIDGVDDLSMTTNGHTLRALARPLAEAGLRRVNVSLDSLDPRRFARITRGGSLARVLEGIAAARAAGLTPVKVNVVVMAGENDDEVVDIARAFAPDADTTVVRFIEYMPFEARWHRTASAAGMRERLAEAFGPLEAAELPVGGGPAKYARLPGSGLRVGFIAPLTEHFCARCNRLRLLADGHLRTCLAHEDTPNLRDAVRAGVGVEALQALILDIVRGKPPGHEAAVEGGRAFEGVMTAIGG